MKIKIIFISILSIAAINLTSCQQGSNDINITAEEFLSLSDTTNTMILDVRTSSEYESGHLENALLMDIYATDFVEKMNKLNKNKTYYVYCRSGGRSKSAVFMMRKEGIPNAYNIRGGIIQLTRYGARLAK